MERAVAQLFLKCNTNSNYTITKSEAICIY